MKLQHDDTLSSNFAFKLNLRRYAKESDDEGDKDEEAVEHDYLSPFLPALISGQKLSKSEVGLCRLNR